MSPEVLECKPNATSRRHKASSTAPLAYDARVLSVVLRYASPAFVARLRAFDPRYPEAYNALVDEGIVDGPHAVAANRPTPPTDGDERLLTEGLWDPSLSHASAMIWAMLVAGEDRAVIELSRRGDGFDEAHEELYLVGRVENVKFSAFDLISPTYVLTFNRENLARLADLYGESSGR